MRFMRHAPVFAVAMAASFGSAFSSGSAKAQCGITLTCAGVTDPNYCNNHAIKDDIPVGGACCSWQGPACNLCGLPGNPTNVCFAGADCGLTNVAGSGLPNDLVCCQPGGGFRGFGEQCSDEPDAGRCCLGTCHNAYCCGDQGQFGSGPNNCNCAVDGQPDRSGGKYTNCCSGYGSNGICGTMPQHYCLAQADCGPQGTCTQNADCCLDVGSSQVCNVGDDCCSGQCQNHVCVAANAAGGPCQADSDCGKGFFCSGHICVGLAGAGQPCNDSDDCAAGACGYCHNNYVCAVQPVCDQTRGDRGYQTCCSQNGVACAQISCGPGNAPCCNVCDSTTSQCAACIPSGHGTCTANRDCCSGLVCDVGEGICETCDADKECGDTTKYNCKAGACCSISGQPCGVGTTCCNGACGNGNFCP